MLAAKIGGFQFRGYPTPKAAIGNRGYSPPDAASCLGLANQNHKRVTDGSGHCEAVKMEKVRNGSIIVMERRATHQPAGTATPRTQKAPLSRGFRLNHGGKPGFTLGTAIKRSAGFQDRSIQPLAHFPFASPGTSVALPASAAP